MIKNKRSLKRFSYSSVVEHIAGFNKKRGWSPEAGDIAKSIVIEASELLEKYQWSETNLVRKSSLANKKNIEEIGEEVADVFWYLVTFCKKENIDLLAVSMDKLKKNEVKYPESKFKKGHNEKFYISQKRKYREARQK